MRALLSIPVLLAALILQTTVLSRITLLGGNADLVLLIVIAWSIQEEVDTTWQWAVIGGLLVGLVSKLPFYFYIPLFVITAGFAFWLRRRFWQVPVISMFLTTVIGTALIQTATMLVLQFTETPFSFSEAFGFVILPSLLLNLLLAIPVYAIITDLARSVYRTARIE
ncbi:MAG: hypothetical protein AAGU25_05395 [bacterium]